MTIRIWHKVGLKSKDNALSQKLMKMFPQFKQRLTVHTVLLARTQVSCPSLLEILNFKSNPSLGPGILIPKYVPSPSVSHLFGSPSLSYFHLSPMSTQLPDWPAAPYQSTSDVYVPSSRL